MGKYYRNCDIVDLYAIFKGGSVLPKFHAGSEDSTLPVGEWSFWFNRPVVFANTLAVVTSEFEPEVKGEMTIGWDDPWDEFNYLQGKLEEFGTSKPISPSFVAVNWFSPLEPSKPEEEMTIGEMAVWKRQLADRKRSIDRIFCELGKPDDYQAFLAWVETKPKFFLTTDLEDLTKEVWKYPQDVAEVIPDEEDDD